MLSWFCLAFSRLQITPPPPSIFQPEIPSIPFLQKGDESMLGDKSSNNNKNRRMTMGSFVFTHSRYTEPSSNVTIYKSPLKSSIHNNGHKNHPQNTKHAKYHNSCQLEKTICNKNRMLEGFSDCCGLNVICYSW